jgi:cytochrome c oxidase subunit 2
MKLLRRALLAGGALAALWPASALAVPRPYWHPGPPWAPLQGRSSEVLLISNLFWIVFALSVIMFIIICAGIFISLARFSHKPGDPEPPQVFGNRTVELAWTIVPTLILTIAFIATVKAIHDINTPTKGTILNVNVIGHQWWWEFNYPGYRVTTADELHVPIDQPLHFHITSADVVHSFWTPQLQRQIDANPGIDNAVFVTLNTPGVYSGMCYEYCGTAHAWMKYRVVVQTQAQFQAWIKQQQAPAKHGAQLASVAPAGTASLVEYGEKVFNNETCVTCHAINYSHSPAIGTVAPNLTHFGSRWTIGAGAAPNDMSDLVSWIQDPFTYKPGIIMPGYPQLSIHDLRALAAYLESLK